MAQQRQRPNLATVQQRGQACAITRLFRAVLAEAVKDDDAAQWIQTKDAQLVCDLAGVECEAVQRAIDRGDVPKRKAKVPTKPPSRRKKCGKI